MEWTKAYFESFLDLGMSSTCAERKDKQVGNKIGSMFTLMVIQRVLMVDIFMIQESKRCLSVQMPYSWRMIIS